MAEVREGVFQFHSVVLERLSSSRIETAHRRDLRRELFEGAKSTAAH